MPLKTGKHRVDKSRANERIDSPEKSVMRAYTAAVEKCNHLAGLSSGVRVLSRSPIGQAEPCTSDPDIAFASRRQGISLLSGKQSRAVPIQIAPKRKTLQKRAKRHTHDRMSHGYNPDSKRSRPRDQWFSKRETRPADCEVSSKENVGDNHKSSEGTSSSDLEKAIPVSFRTPGVLGGDPMAFLTNTRTTLHRHLEKHCWQLGLQCPIRQMNESERGQLLQKLLEFC